MAVTLGMAGHRPYFSKIRYLARLTYVRRLGARSAQLAIDLAPVADPYHGHGAHGITDLIDDAVIAYADAVGIDLCELCYALRSRLPGERRKAGHDPVEEGPREAVEGPPCRWVDLNSVRGHVSGASAAA